MIQLKFSPFPELRTDRLLLRRLAETDAPVIYFLRSDPTVLKYLGREPIGSEPEAIEFIGKINASVDSNESILWAICLKDKSQELIGTICFWNIQPEHHRSEIGYVLHPENWGKGFMVEALKAILTFGFKTIGLHSVEARLSPANTASIKLLESTGFMKEAYFREDYFFNERYEDTLVYCLLEKERL